MCLIVAKPPKGVVLRRELREAFRCNDDGAGFMYNANGELRIYKGFFGFRSFYKAFRACERAYPESTFVLHFRIATHGRNTPENCHPFRVHERLGFAHNGIISELGSTLVSDSMTLVDTYLKRLPPDFIHRDEIWQKVETVATQSNSKFALLDGDGNLKLANEKAGHWSGNCWYSNHSYIVLPNQKAHHPIIYEPYFSGTGWYDNETTTIRGFQGSYERCRTCGSYDKSTLMHELAGKYYCDGCWEILEAYSSVCCPACGCSTHLKANLICEMCQTPMEEDDVSEQLKVLREYEGV